MLQFGYSLIFSPSPQIDQNTATSQVPSSLAESIYSLIGKVVNLSGSACSRKEMENANQILQIHNLIEEVAYAAFAEIVQELNIKQDSITEEQSGRILAHIKRKAHIEMYKKGGYISERTKLLDPSQVEKVIIAVAHIVHDRDTRLTDALYPTLSEFLLGFDGHNRFVKNTLIGSWFKLPQFCDPDDAHLDQIKANVKFYEQMNNQLDFDLKEVLDKRKAFWNAYFSDKLEIGGNLGSSSKSSSVEFLEIIEVRSRFQGLAAKGNEQTGEQDSNEEGKVKGLPKQLSEWKFEAKDGSNRVYVLSGVDLEERLANYLSDEQTGAFFEPRHLYNRVRCKKMKFSPLIENVNITVRQFLMNYFPESLENLSD